MLKSIMSSPAYSGDSLGVGVLSVAVISPSGDRRGAMVKALAGPQARVALTLSTIPNRQEISRVMEAKCDVVIVDIEGSPDDAIDLVENISSIENSITVMVFGRPEPDLLVRAMRAGAREFLAEPLAPGTVGIALIRAAARLQEGKRQKRVTGKMFVFTGAKGGAGVTTVASNFALALAREAEAIGPPDPEHKAAGNKDAPNNNSPAKVALVDLNLSLGDAALALGVRSKFSVMDALENESRIDSEYLAALLAKHESGLSVLCAPETSNFGHPSLSGINAILQTLRGDVDYVVLDAGSTPPEHFRRLFREANTVYLITPVTVVGLRNANRLITQFFEDSSNVEVVLNGNQPRLDEIDEASVTKALTRSASWRIPQDPAVVRAQNMGTPLVLSQSPASRAVVEMAIMLVDLGRNDVGRVAEYQTVQLTDVMKVERYSHVMHITSNVTGKLRPGQTAFDALRAGLPAGHRLRRPQGPRDADHRRGRAAEARAVRRGRRLYRFHRQYGYVHRAADPGPPGKTAYIQAGGGVVYDSDPGEEYEETSARPEACSRRSRSPSRSSIAKGFARSRFVMLYDRTLIQIRERSFLDLLDLSLFVIRARPIVLALTARRGNCPLGRAQLLVALRSGLFAHGLDHAADSRGSLGDGALDLGPGRPNVRGAAQAVSNSEDVARSFSRTPGRPASGARGPAHDLRLLSLHASAILLI